MEFYASINVLVAQLTKFIYLWSLNRQLKHNIYNLNNKLQSIKNINPK